MTVGELIDYLSSLPLDLDVVLPSEMWGTIQLMEVDIDVQIPYFVQIGSC